MSLVNTAMESQEDSIDIAKLKRFALGLAVRALCGVLLPCRHANSIGYHLGK
jgi:hypothetical protein